MLDSGRHNVLAPENTEDSIPLCFFLLLPLNLCLYLCLQKNITLTSLVCVVLACVFIHVCADLLARGAKERQLSAFFASQQTGSCRLIRDNAVLT